jgi:PIN domain nuclease of toxin-antitoxin system
VILLDTHVVIWLMVQPELLSADARNAIRQARVSREPLACSPVSLYEAAYAERRGRLPLIENIHIFLGAVRSILEMAPLTPEIVIRAALFPDSFHGDPMDRMIAATAVELNCPLISGDNRIRSFDACRTIW